ncbi:vesicle transport protein GOT1B-like isoform X2 [Fundulus heteroclitus]|uniref:vesicle transport protein GOT1B-like isoform X2 n=1 Tax=Fundulus heteroclitus TaxID=8078 RepID=UPI00165C0B21|nr:vesicle transport protein GOT1B-like isoform X2 [Fundulus heteroclitus]
MTAPGRRSAAGGRSTWVTQLVPVSRKLSALERVFPEDVAVDAVRGSCHPTHYQRDITRLLLVYWFLCFFSLTYRWSVEMISLTDSQKIGIGLTGFGVFFLFFGMILFFDKALLAIGNILFVAGLAFVIGLERTFRFFFQKHKLKATSFFLGGVFVVLIGWPIIGVVLEVYGFFLLFRGFFPVIVGFIRRIPVLGSILNLPFISAPS